MWYCLKSKPSKEYTLQSNLQRQGVWNYLPEIPVDIRIHRKRAKKMLPMFTGYLFAYLEPGLTDFSKIKKTPGLAYVVSFCDEPAKLTEAEIELVRHMEAELKPPREYQRGERVRVNSGKFLGYEGIFHAKSGKERADILLSFLGSHRSINIKLRELDPVE